MDVLSGSIVTKDGIIEGYILIEDRKIIDIIEGDHRGPSLANGLITTPLVNAHTHCADMGLRVRPGMGLKELVAPPNGLKHVYLRNISDSALESNIREYSALSDENGIGTFIDFREGGVKGCRILRRAAPGSTILGRPISNMYDPEEIDDILDIADGIGLPSISDMDRSYIEDVADHVRKRNKIFAIHASERVREDIDIILSLDPSFIVHMVEATDSDMLKCAESEVPVVICTRSNLYFGKTPPIKRMLDCGIDVSIGTDNAMLATPDIRAETSVFWNILASQGGSIEELEGIMFMNGQKLLYPHNKIPVSVGMAADLTVFPYEGAFGMRKVLENGEHIFRYRP